MMLMWSQLDAQLRMNLWKSWISSPATLSKVRSTTDVVSADVDFWSSPFLWHVSQAESVMAPTPAALSPGEFIKHPTESYPLQPYSALHPIDWDLPGLGWSLYNPLYDICEKAFREADFERLPIVNSKICPVRGRGLKKPPKISVKGSWNVYIPFWAMCAWPTFILHQQLGCSWQICGNSYKDIQGWESVSRML